MTLLNREAILTADDLKTQDVDVPEWGGTVRIRVLSGTQREAYSKSLIGPDNKAAYDGYAEKLVAVSVIDESGALCFTLDDIHALGGKNADALKRVYDAASVLNGMTAAAVETAEGN